jgi:hypothetical protein
MTEERLTKIYKYIRIVIFVIPVVVIIVGFYLVLFPVDSYSYYPNDQKLSKFDISKNTDSNEISFGVFPERSYRYIDLQMNFGKNISSNCLSGANVTLSRSYQAFLYPTADPITNSDQLKDILFEGNKTKYPNDSLLHLKPTNEVFLISHGKKILFPGPEIFTAFGYNFDNLVDVEQSDIDQYPNADQKVFLWTMPHPDGTIFQAYPSHSIYIIFNGEKHQIEDKNLLDAVWPGNYTIPVSDFDPENNLKCPVKSGTTQINCRFDSAMISDTGHYYYFSIKFPENCRVAEVFPAKSKIQFHSERSVATIKDSLKTIAASILTRYFYKQ